MLLYTMHHILIYDRSIFTINNQIEKDKKDVTFETWQFQLFLKSGKEKKKERKKSCKTVRRDLYKKRLLIEVFW